MTLRMDNGYWPLTLQKCILGIWWFVVVLPSWPFTLRSFHKILSSWNSLGISQTGHRWSSINWRCIRMDAYFVGRMYVYFMCMNMFKYAWTFGCIHHIYVYTCFVSGVIWFFFFFSILLQEPPRRHKDSGASLKRKEIDSDPDSQPRKPPTHRRMAVVFDSDEE